MTQQSPTEVVKRSRSFSIRQATGAFTLEVPPSESKAASATTSQPDPNAEEVLKLEPVTADDDNVSGEHYEVMSEKDAPVVIYLEKVENVPKASWTNPLNQLFGQKRPASPKNVVINSSANHTGNGGAEVVSPSVETDYTVAPTSDQNGDPASPPISPAVIERISIRLYRAGLEVTGVCNGAGNRMMFIAL